LSDKQRELDAAKARVSTLESQLASAQSELSATQQAVFVAIAVPSMVAVLLGVLLARKKK
jgi:ElaB/YqjD/DUF883 family membrane-anchored ribosome-binding protein